MHRSIRFHHSADTQAPLQPSCGQLVPQGDKGIIRRLELGLRGKIRATRNRHKSFELRRAFAGLTSTFESDPRTYLELCAHNPKTHKGCAHNSTYVRTRFSGVDVSRAELISKSTDLRQTCARSGVDHLASGRRPRVPAVADGGLNKERAGEERMPLRLQELLESRGRAFQLPRLQSALPNNEGAPSFATKQFPNFGVAGLVAGELGEPELFMGRGHRPAARTGVTVPETAVDEDDFASAGEYEVGAARHVAAVEPIAVAETRHDASDRQLGRRVARADGSHYATALGDGKRIGHATATRRRGAVSVRNEMISNTAATTPGCGGISWSHGMPRRRPS